MNDIVERFGRAAVTATSLALIVAALLAIAPSGVDARSVFASNPNAPVFDEETFAVRSVSEDASSGDAIGKPVRATDADNDTLTYLLATGQDASHFSIDATSGQLRTGVNWNEQAGSSFRVNVEVHDGKDQDGNSDTTIDATILVMIDVVAGSGQQQDPFGGGFGPAPVAPKFADGFRAAREVFDNAASGDPVGEPVVAAQEDNLAITYSLSGTDAASFTVDEDTGQIRVSEGVSLVIDRSFTLNLTATDSAGFGAIIIVNILVVETPYHDYDANQNRVIERDEVFAAISDYFDGEILKEEVIALISLYFSQT